MTAAHAHAALAAWKQDYNEARPHGAIGNKPTITATNHNGAASPPMGKSRKTLVTGSPKNGLGAPVVGLYPNLEEFEGLRSRRAVDRASRERRAGAVYDAPVPAAS